MKTYCLLVGLFFASPELANAQSTAPLRLVQSIPLSNVKGRIDHMDVDVKGMRLFVAGLENGSVEVVDLRAGKWVRSILGFQKPQGIAYVESLNKCLWPAVTTECSASSALTLSNCLIPSSWILGPTE